MSTFSTHVSGRRMERSPNYRTVVFVASPLGTTQVAVNMDVDGELVTAEWFLSRNQLPLMAELLEECAAAVRSEIAQAEKVPVSA